MSGQTNPQTDNNDMEAAKQIVLAEARLVYPAHSRGLDVLPFVSRPSIATTNNEIGSFHTRKEVHWMILIAFTSPGQFSNVQSGGLGPDPFSAMRSLGEVISNELLQVQETSALVPTHETQTVHEPAQSSDTANSMRAGQARTGSLDAVESNGSRKMVRNEDDIRQRPEDLDEPARSYQTPSIRRPSRSSGVHVEEGSAPPVGRSKHRGSTSAKRGEATPVTARPVRTDSAAPDQDTQSDQAESREVKAAGQRRSGRSKPTTTAQHYYKPAGSGLKRTRTKEAPSNTTDLTTVKAEAQRQTSEEVKQMTDEEHVAWLQLLPNKNYDDMAIKPPDIVKTFKGFWRAARAKTGDWIRVKSYETEGERQERLEAKKEERRQREEAKEETEGKSESRTRSKRRRNQTGGAPTEASAEASETDDNSEEVQESLETGDDAVDRC